MLSPALVKEKAKELGFTLVGITGDLDPAHAAFNQWWLDQGYHGSMAFLERQRERRRSIRQILPEAESVVVCALRFPAGNSPVPPEFTPLEQEPQGKVARYATGEDYHREILNKLNLLAEFMDRAGGLAPNSSKAYVDTGAINERALAAQSGLGWIGKNAMLIHPEEGSWLWLGEVITPLRLIPDLPIADRCGTCTRCIDACPTEAILPGKRAIDSRRCIAYLTIEHRGPIPSEFQAKIGEWLLGCDICQEVCPWNSQSLRRGRKNIGEPLPARFALAPLEKLDDSMFRQKLGQSALSRPKRAGIQRNVQIVRENARRELGPEET